MNPTRAEQHKECGQGISMVVGRKAQQRHLGPLGSKVRKEHVKLSHCIEGRKEEFTQEVNSSCGCALMNTWTSTREA